MRFFPPNNDMHIMYLKGFYWCINILISPGKEPNPVREPDSVLCEPYQEIITHTPMRELIGKLNPTCAVRVEGI